VRHQIFYITLHQMIRFRAILCQLMADIAPLLIIFKNTAKIPLSDFTEVWNGSPLSVPYAPSGHYLLTTCTLTTL